MNSNSHWALVQGAPLNTESYFKYRSYVMFVLCTCSCHCSLIQRWFVCYYRCNNVNIQCTEVVVKRCKGKSNCVDYLCTLMFMKMVWYGMVRYVVARYDMVWHGTVWHSMVRYGMAQYGMVWYGYMPDTAHTCHYNKTPNYEHRRDKPLTNSSHFLMSMCTQDKVQLLDLCLQPLTFSAVFKIPLGF